VGDLIDESPRRSIASYLLAIFVDSMLGNDYTRSLVHPECDLTEQRHGHHAVSPVSQQMRRRLMPAAPPMMDDALSIWP
jgi:hypothetical protein